MNSTTHATRVKTSKILFDATKPHPAPRKFGRGLNRYTGQHTKEPFTASDAAWAAEFFGNYNANLALADAQADADWDHEVDRLAAEYDRMMAGR